MWLEEKCFLNKQTFQLYKACFTSNSVDPLLRTTSFQTATLYCLGWTHTGHPHFRAHIQHRRGGRHDRGTLAELECRRRLSTLRSVFGSSRLMCSESSEQLPFDEEYLPLLLDEIFLFLIEFSFLSSTSSGVAPIYSTIWTTWMALASTTNRLGRGTTQEREPSEVCQFC
mmetsp:Transcript_55983/g.62662  ORF Transcript_55983/g.62662 Transcript_55983/m.62662 type:complete len:170 (+) Transcript_55983:976-1485(+)